MKRNPLTDTELIDFLATYVTTYSHGPGKTRFGFDFNTARKTSEEYRENFRVSLMQEYYEKYG